MESFHWILHGVLSLSLIIFMTDALTMTWVRRVYELVYHVFSAIGGQVIMIDLDHLKMINDTYDHAGGDVALRVAAEIFRKKSWPFIFRFGGEEFVILGFRMKRERALILAEEIRQEIMAQEVWLFRVDGATWEKVSVTVSIGIGRWQQDADHALYLAKEHGRNCVREGLA